MQAALWRSRSLWDNLDWVYLDYILRPSSVERLPGQQWKIESVIFLKLYLYLYWDPALPWLMYNFYLFYPRLLLWPIDVIMWEEHYGVEPMMAQSSWIKLIQIYKFWRFVKKKKNLGLFRIVFRPIIVSKYDLNTWHFW